MKRRPFFDGEIVGREMRRLKAKGSFQVGCQFLQGLAWFGVDQVKIKIIKAGFPDDRQRLLGFIGRVNPSEELEQTGLKRLNSDTDPIHTAGAVAEKIRSVDGPRVGFERNFAFRNKRPLGRYPFENLSNTFRVKS